MLQYLKFLLLFPLFGAALELTFVASIHCPHSPLPHLEDTNLLYIGQRPRFSTCTAVAWFPDQHHLMSANLIANTMQIVDYNEEEGSLSARQFFSPLLGTQLAKPEHLCFSPDGTLLAVANGGGGKITFYAVSKESSTIDPNPIAVLKESGKAKFHSVRFSPNGRYLACLTFDNEAKISIYKIVQEEKGLSFIRSQSFANPYSFIKPKGIDFSPDQRFIAICYSRRALWNPNENLQGVAEIYSFDAAVGRMNPSPISRIEANLSVPEDIIFDPLDPYLFISNQGNDTITVHEFNPESGMFQEPLHTCLKNPGAQLSFPHGIAISRNGTFLASSNYGDDKITVYKIQR